MSDCGYIKFINEEEKLEETRVNHFCQKCNKSSGSVECQTCQRYLCGKGVESHRHGDSNREIHNEKGSKENQTKATSSKRKTFSNIGCINVKAADENKTCAVTGLTFLQEEILAVTDKANKCVKLVDVDRDVVTSKIRLTSDPQDLTVVPPDMLAVTLKEEAIQLISTKPELAKIRQIKTNGKCRGITYNENRFVVTFGGLLFSKVQILNLTGDILNTFDFTEKEDYLVYDPRSVNVSLDGNHIYVTDCLKSRLFRLSWNGKVTGVYKDLGEITGLAVADNETLYTCSRDRNSVRSFTADLSKSKIVLDVNDGIIGPYALAFSANKNSLYISYRKGPDEGRNNIHVFKSS